ncbi:hypothetical protein chiPu_0021633 [Chiloscyllium punctatum]|uniref:Uncharacterized protein n=1 Tax=Chiloscyllium punctatum TaxID=137246 RepID=A0A401RJ55_CHIPU|nr:hypothetical protein [Chiloscyllium punctatum]
MQQGGGRTAWGQYRVVSVRSGSGGAWGDAVLGGGSGEQDPGVGVAPHSSVSVSLPVQFDNFKRVFKVVEEMKGPLVENIQQNFLLSDRLARDYAAVVFFANNRFETGKKKLQYLTFEDFACCAEQLIQNWTLGAVGTGGIALALKPFQRMRFTVPARNLQANQSGHLVSKVYEMTLSFDDYGRTLLK